jgi:hypothetical protein
MTGEKLGYVYGAVSAADLTGKEGYAVVISGSGTNTVPKVAIAGAGVKIDGVVLRGDVVGAMNRIGKDGFIMMKVGATISAAGEVEINASGLIIPKASGTAIGKVMAAAATNDVVPVFVY